MSANTVIKQPWKAVYLTGLFPGAGHIYAGARSKGIFLVVLTIVIDLILLGGIVGFLMFDEQETSRTAMFASAGAFFIIMFIDIYALFDSHKCARRFNEANSIEVHSTGQKKSWLAAFLSDFFPGIGQFYNGQVLKGIAVAAAAFGLIAGEVYYYQVFFLYFALCFFSIKDAFDSAERRNGSSERLLYQGNGLLVFITIVLFLHSIPFGQLIKENWLKAYTIPAGSMIPTLQLGDRLLIDKRQITLDRLQRGDIVVFPYPQNPEKNFIKRIVALAGDKVQFMNGDLYINDQLVPRSTIETKPGQFNMSGSTKIIVYEERIDGRTHRIQHLRDNLVSYNTGTFLVPKDEVFVLGDNRDNSQDSRVWGSVPKRTIEGKAIKLYWSWDREGKKVNWERIGQKIL